MEDRFKFRQWNSRVEGMLTFEMLKNASALAVKYNLHEVGMFLPIFDSDMILMQCTGLKDKNGSLIFEGDLVEHYYRGRLALSDVIYNQEFSCFCLGIGSGSSTKSHPIKITNKMEVIGNIYEKPELLKRL